jgi:membrane protein
MADVSNFGTVGPEALGAAGTEDLSAATAEVVIDSDSAAVAVLPAAELSPQGTRKRIADLRSRWRQLREQGEPKWRILREQGAPLVKYLMESEVHTYAFSVAANAIISFIPLVVLLYSLSSAIFNARIHPTKQEIVTHVVQKEDVMTRAVDNLLVNFFPQTTSSLWFDIREKAPRHVHIVSFVMILISCTGIFLPLEVALNQAWGISKGRNFVMNQVVSIGLAMLMVVLGFISVMLNTAGLHVLHFLSFHHVDPSDFLKKDINAFWRGISYLWMAVSSGAACILFFFAIYWILPNRKVPWRPVLRVSIVTGICWIVSKYIVTALLPLMAPEKLYGPFTVAVGLLFWGYISGLILFAGAQFSASRLVEHQEAHV